MASHVTDAFVLENCEYFTSVQLWPLRNEINPKIWLGNFEEHERIHARYLLNSFLYLSSSIIEHMVIDNFEALSQMVTLPYGPYGGGHNGKSRWRNFASNLRVVIVQGEDARPTDSGYIFSRIARDALDIDESRILDVPEAIQALEEGLDEPLVFVDDFVGSGDQFLDTWTKRRNVKTRSVSFCELSRRKRGPYIYCPVLATESGVKAIRNAQPEVIVQPGHELPASYSVFHPKSLVWPDELRSTATNFIKAASARAGITDTDGGPKDWRGYNKLGLTIAFAHGVPDATIPLFWWESETWKPLKKRHREP
jgi:hypothetical protein